MIRSPQVNQTKLTMAEKARRSLEMMEASSSTPLTDVEKARRCLVAAKVHLGSARNLKTEIKNGVIEQIDRMYEIVKAIYRSNKDEGMKEKSDKAISAEGERMKECVDKATSTEGESVKRCVDKVVGTYGQYTTNSIEQRATEKEISKLMEVIKEHTHTIHKNEEIMKRLAEKLENAATREESLTYAEVATKRPSTKINELGALHSVLVSSKDPAETSDEVLTKACKAIDAKEGWVKVERVRKVKDQKVIIGCKTKEDREKVKERLGKRPDLNVKDVSNKDPLIVLRDVFNFTTEEDILKAIKNQNKALLEGIQGEEDRMKVVYCRKARNPLQKHVVLRVSPIIWQRSTQEGRMYVDMQRVKVDDQSPLVQCSCCLGYGHTARHCTEKTQICGHCGGPHMRTECQQRSKAEPPQCCNCKAAGLSSTEHGAFSEDCPVRKKWDALARSMVSYC